MVTDILAAVVMAKLEADGDILGERAKALAHRLLDRLERLEAIAAAAGMNANALGRAVIDSDDCSVTVSAARVSSLQGCLAFAGHHRGQVGAPHHIDPLGGDCAVVGLWATRLAGT